MPITEVDKIAVLIVFDHNRTAKLADTFRHRGTSHSGENAFTNSIEKTGERASTDDVLRLLGTRGAEARV